MDVVPFPAILREVTDSSKRRMYWYMSTYMYCTIEVTFFAGKFSYIRFMCEYVAGNPLCQTLTHLQCPPITRWNPMDPSHLEDLRLQSWTNLWPPLIVFPARLISLPSTLLLVSPPQVAQGLPRPASTEFF